MSCENMNCALDYVQDDDKNSLYNQRLYDQHENNVRCYEENPVEIVEKFDTSFTKRNILKWIIAIIIIIAVAYGAYYFYTRRGKIVNVDYNAGATVGPMSPPITIYN